MTDYDHADPMGNHRQTSPPTGQGEPSPFAPIFAELERATTKFPTWPTDPLHALAVLGEEFGELTKDMLQMVYEPHKTSRETVRTEALQTAAMALRLFASLDRYEYVPGAQHQQGAASGQAEAPADDRLAQAMQIINDAWMALPDEYRVEHDDDPSGNPLPSAVRALAGRRASMDEREKFEAWAEPILGDNNPTWRESGDCELAWQAWQARAALSAPAQAAAQAPEAAPVEGVTPHGTPKAMLDRAAAPRAPGAEPRACTCHPDDSPQVCQQKFAASECQRAALTPNTPAEPAAQQAIEVDMLREVYWDARRVLRNMGVDATAHYAALNDMDASIEKVKQLDGGTYEAEPAAPVQAARAPLTDEQIDLITNDGMRSAAGGIYATRVYEFARAIERAHGITEQGKQEGGR